MKLFGNINVSLESLKIKVSNINGKNKMIMWDNEWFDNRWIYMTINDKKIYEMNDDKKDWLLYYRSRARDFIYVGNFSNWKFNWEWSIFFSDWSKYVWDWTDGKIGSEWRKYENGNRVSCQNITDEVNEKIECEMKGVAEIDKNTFENLCNKPSLTLSQIKQVAWYANKIRQWYLSLSLTSIDNEIVAKFAKHQWDLSFLWLGKISNEVVTELAKVENLNIFMSILTKKQKRILKNRKN